jgi:hypothetical protein
VSSRGAKGRLRSVMPRPAEFAFSYVLRGPDVRDDIEDVVRQAVHEYEKQILPGRFKVERTGTMLHVTPAYVRKKAGNIVPVESVLDARISLDEQEWPAIEGIRAILDALKEATGVSVKLTVRPINLLMQHRVRIAANDEPAGSVLGRLLETHPAPMSWVVGYDIQSHQHILSIYVVQPR